MLYKINPATGALIWSHKVSDYTGLSNSRARNSPAIGASVVVIGDMTTHPTEAVPGARVIAVNKVTGALVWNTLVNSAPYSSITGSPVIYGNTVYIGMTGRDEVQAGTDPTFVPSTRGAVVALNLSTGAILWKVYTVPTGYTGGSVWGSSPVIWPAQNFLLVSTGNNFSVPATASACVTKAGTSVSGQLACLDPTDYVDSILALDLGTGAVRWSRRLQGADTSTLACQAGFKSCPPAPGPDYDFGSMPNLTWVPNFVGVPDDRGGTSQNYLLGAGQKSGIYWGLNPANGGVFWSTLIGHGNILWGSAINTDDLNQVFVSLDNPNHLANVLAGNNGVGIPWNAGAWGSISLLNGHWKWQHKAHG